jgi:DNA polymerase I-like protein with 3'-5' exonuclease and polymerase domains
MVTLLEELSGASKMQGTYVEGFLTHLRSDGRFHSNYLLAHQESFENDDEEGGAVTGRTSATGPAVQTIPKRVVRAKALRQCYPAPPGMVMLELDFKQGELMVIACIANEMHMLEIFRAGGDIHTETMIEVNEFDHDLIEKLAKEDPEKFATLRTGAKAGNFGLVFGMRENGFVRYAWGNYKLKFTVEEAKTFRDKFLCELYPGLPKYHDRQRNFVRQYGYVESPLGRVRHLPLGQMRVNDSTPGHIRLAVAKAELQSINAPVQSTLTDMTQLAIVEIDRQLPEVEIVAMVHDSIVAYAPEDRADELARKCATIMGSLPLREWFRWDHQINFSADIKKGPTLGDMKELALAA